MPTVVLDNGPLWQGSGREQNPDDDVELPGQYL
jgi:hypothetical protein